MKKMVRLLSSFLALVAGVSTAYGQPDSLNVRSVGRAFFGPPWSLFGRGDTIFLGAGGALLIIDASNPDTLSLIGYCYTPGQPRDIYVSGDYAYIAEWECGLTIVDISDLSNPTPVLLFATPDTTRGVFVKDSLAYVAVEDTGLLILNVSDPSNPVEVGRYDTFWALDVWVQDTLAYVADGDSGFCVINVSDPTHPSGVGRLLYETGWMPVNVSVKDSLAFVCILWGGGTIINVADPANPSVLSTLPSSNGMYVVDTLLYSAGWDEFCVYNISYPSNPILIGTGNIDGCGYDVCVRGDYAYPITSYWGWMGDGPNRLWRLDVSNPSTPAVVDYYQTTNSAYDCPNSVSLCGDHAYMGAGGFLVVDVSDPALPIQASYRDSLWTYGVLVDSPLAYTCCPVGSRGGFRKIDVSDPHNPVLVDSNNQVGGFDLDGGLGTFCLADGEQGLWIMYGMSVTHGQIPMGMAKAVAFRNPYAYVADESYGLRIVDVVDVVEVGLCYTGMGCHEVAVSGDYAYLVGDGFWVVDVSDPYNPQLIGEFPISGYGYGMTISGNLAYISTWSPSGLTILDISNPHSPQVVGYYKTSNRRPSRGIAVSGNLIYLTGDDSGFYVLEWYGTGLEEEARHSPDHKTPSLSQNSPNPFSSRTAIPYSLPSAVGEPHTAVSLSIYDAAGRLVKTLVDELKEPGSYVSTWDGRDEGGEEVPCGVYFYRLSATRQGGCASGGRAEGLTATKKIVLLR